MRIAQLAPLAESVPPKLYGGTERVVAWLVDELVELGPRCHAVRERRLPDEGQASFACGPRRCASGERERIPIPPAPFLLEAIAKRAGRIRRHPLSYRLARAPTARPARRAVSHDHAWSARSCRDCPTSSVSFPKLPSYRFRTTSVAASGCELARHYPAWTARRPVSSFIRPGILPGVSRTLDGGEGAGGCHPDRAELSECRCASPPKFRGPRPPTLGSI